MPGSSSLPNLTDPSAIAERLMQRAHTRDGLPEIAVGLTFLFASGLIYAQAVLPRESMAFKITVIGFAILLPVLCMGAPSALKWVRGRYLVARIGYVQHKPIGRKGIATGIVVAAVLAAMIIGATELSRPDGWLLAGTGLLGGALAAWCGRLPRFVIGGTLIAATGLALACLGVSLPAGFAILFGIEGMLAVVSGALIFLHLLRMPAET